MVSAYWLEQRRPHWERMDQILRNTGGAGLRKLNRDELRELSLLYRQLATDLSVLRTDPSAQVYARHLNRLLGLAHNIIYTGGRANPLQIFTFFLREYPQIFRRNFRYVLAAFAIFLFAAVCGTILSFYDPDFSLMVIGPGMMHTIEHHKMWTDSIVSIKPLASSGIMTNNLSVSFMTYSLGVTAGLGTLYMLFFNGLLIGVIGSACWMNGMSLQLWSFVAPHGVLELPAIFIAGGAGLLLAKGMLFPGAYSRRDSFRMAGAESVRLLVGIIPMLIVAGMFEGFVSPTGLAPSFKFVLGTVLFTMLVIYLAMPAGNKTATKAGSAL